MRGKTYKFTIDASAVDCAETFFRIVGNLEEAKEGTLKPLSILLPGGKKVEATGSYLGLIKNLHVILVEPKLSETELMVLGHKVGGVAMNDLLSWANSHLMPAAESFSEELEEAKKK